MKLTLLAINFYEDRADQARQKITAAVEVSGAELSGNLEIPLSEQEREQVDVLEQSILDTLRATIQTARG